MGKRDGETEEERAVRKAAKKAAKEAGSDDEKEQSKEERKAAKKKAKKAEEEEEEAKNERKAAKKASKRALEDSEEAAKKKSKTGPSPSLPPRCSPRIIAQAIISGGQDMPDMALEGGGGERTGPMTPAEFLLEHNVTVTGPFNDKQPIMTYEDAPIDPRLKRAFGDAGFTSPSPIQAVSWPIVREGADTVAVAKTGSGKTLGFLTPAFDMILREGRMPKPGMGPSCLVLAPTRELAMQIHQECEKFGRCIGIRSSVVYGGVPKGTQISGLMRMHPQIVIATPGRMNDFLQMLNPPVTTMKGTS